MPSRNPASRLDSGLIARKGEATPTVSAATAEQPQTSVPHNKELVMDNVTALPHGTAGTIAVSVRLDPVRYERLKIHGVRNRLTNQIIMVEALDFYLNSRT